MEISQTRETQSERGRSEAAIPFVDLPRVDWKNGRPYAITRLSADYAKSLEALALTKEMSIKALPITPGWEDGAKTSPTTVRYAPIQHSS
jgi:hypothetical protein